MMRSTSFADVVTLVYECLESMPSLIFPVKSCNLHWTIASIFLVHHRSLLLDSWRHAEAFVRERRATPFLFEVIVEGPAMTPRRSGAVLTAHRVTSEPVRRRSRREIDYLLSKGYKWNDGNDVLIAPNPR